MPYLELCLPCFFYRAPPFPSKSPPHTTGFSSGDVATYMQPLSTQGKPYGTDDMAPYLDSGLTPAFYTTDYTPVPYGEAPGADASTSEVPVRPVEGNDSNLPFSSSGDPADPKTLYSTVQKANKMKETSTGQQNYTNGIPDVQVDRVKKEKEKRDKSGNFFDSDGSLSGEDIAVNKKMKEVASNMSLRGSIRPISGGKT